MRVEGIELHRLLTGVGQGDVDTPILREVNGGEVAHDLRSLLIRQFGIALDKLLDVILRERMLIAHGLRVNGALRNTLFNKEVLDTADAAF